MWELAEWPDNPSRLNRAHAAQTHFRSTFEDLLGKDAPAYERSLKKLAKALHLRLEAETMLKPESAGDLGSALTRMSKTHAVAMIRNKTRVIRIDPPPPRSIGNPGPPILRAFSKQDFLDLYANERYPVGDEQVSVAKIWFHGGGRRTNKDGVEFDPSHIGTREGATAINLYWGLASNVGASLALAARFALLSRSRMFDLALLPNVGAEVGDRRPKFIDEKRPLIVLDVRRHHLRALAKEKLHCAAADPAGAARNNCDFARKPTHGRSSDRRRSSPGSKLSVIRALHRVNG